MNTAQTKIEHSVKNLQFSMETGTAYNFDASSIFSICVTINGELSHYDELKFSWDDLSESENGEFDQNTLPRFMETAVSASIKGYPEISAAEETEKEFVDTIIGKYMAASNRLVEEFVGENYPSVIGNLREAAELAELAIAKIHELSRDEDCVDNFRIFLVDRSNSPSEKNKRGMPRELSEAYRTKQEGGCCGSMDRIVHIDDYEVLVGCNFGH